MYVPQLISLDGKIQKQFGKAHLMMVYLQKLS